MKTKLLTGLFIISLIFASGCSNADYPQETNHIVNTTSIELNNNQIIVQQPNEGDETLTREIVSEEKTLENLQVGGFTRDFKWNYNDYKCYMTLNLYPEVYKMFKQRERTRDYDLFASDIYSKEYIKSLTDGIKKFGKNNGLSDAEIPYLIISFVQSLHYTSDKVTTGFDEYPRFPYETLYDNGGDCEDTSILASAMLNELGYGVVILEFKENIGHMAVGIKCNPSEGQSYYEYNGITFCYLETTTKGWNVGQVPDEFKNSEAIIIPIVEKPSLKIHFISNYAYNFQDVYTNVDVEVKNLGSKTAENTRIYVALQTVDTDKVWAQVQSDALEIQPEETYSYKVTNLHSSTGQPFRIYVRAWGDNVISDETVSDWIYWE